MIIEIESTKASLKEVCLDFIWRCFGGAKNDDLESTWDVYKGNLCPNNV